MPAELLSDVSKAMAKAGAKTATGALKLIDQILALLTKSKEALAEFFKPVWEAIAKWLLKNKKLVESLVDKAKALLSKESKYNELFRDVTKKFLIRNKGALSKEQFLKIAKNIRTHFSIEMHWIDDTAEEFAELYKRWEERPICAVFHPSTLLNRRYGVTLKGPAIYFFDKVNSIRVTAYTLQHELIHVQLWYKMTVEFKELAGLYNKIPSALHEAHVIGTVLKQNRLLNAAKWSIDDIAADLNTLNDNIVRDKVWNEAAKKLFGKTKLELKDLENWDINNYLKKI